MPGTAANELAAAAHRPISCSSRLQTMHARLFTAVLLCFMTAALPSAQSDLDAFMARVLERRDENWKKLQQYVLDERETFRLLGAGGARLFGFEREYTWFIRDGIFVRSPVKANGVTLGENERRRQEDEWIALERRREKRRGAADDRGELPVEADGDVLRQSLEPRFVSAAYFLKFTFDPGRYALAGRETVDGRPALRIEYYPTRLFNDDDREGRRRERRRDPDPEAERLNRQMNKVSLVTLWIDQRTHQILRYTFDNMDMDFLPGRTLVRVDEVTASMRMAEAFPDVWLPDTIRMRFAFTTAAGALDAHYDVQYRDYRLADVKTRIVP
jgi:hypothetical protein